MSSWNSGWQRASVPGVYSSEGAWRVRVRAVDATTGRLRERHRVLGGGSLDDARAFLESLRGELRQDMATPPRRLVEDFGRYWLGVKKPLIDAGTHARYESALTDHAFHHIGRLEIRDLRSLQVQEWINAELRRGYRLATVKGWYRVFRTMIQDAIGDLDLTRDPSRRIRFPVAPDREEKNALLPDQLHRFLTEMRHRFPRHYPLTATLAFTGLRFCHASALRWEDVEWDARILRIRRRQLRGRLGPVTLVKRAPKEYPISPELMAIISVHGRRRRDRQRRKRGWMFPSRTGGLRCPSSLHGPWIACLRAAGVSERFTVHGLRRTFVDLARRAHIDSVVTRSLTGHVTEKMRVHYSSVGIDEQRSAVAAVSALIRPSGDRGGDHPTSGTADR